MSSSMASERTDINKFESAPHRAHLDNDPKDERTLSNRQAAEEKHAKEEDSRSKTITDPLAPAREHGNEPSRGAKIDAEIQREEEELLLKKNN